MGKTFQLDVVTPERLLVSGAATFVTAPGKDGRFGVMPGHTPFVSVLASGELTVTMEGGTPNQRFALSSGYAEVGNDRVTILVERAVEKGQIDTGGAIRDEKEATEKLAQSGFEGPGANVWIKRRDFARTCQQVARTVNG